MYDGTKQSGRNQWAAVLRDPAVFGIRVIVMRRPSPSESADAVYLALRNATSLRRYRLVYHDPSYLIYSLPTT